MSKQQIALMLLFGLMVPAASLSVPEEITTPKKKGHDTSTHRAMEQRAMDRMTGQASSSLMQETKPKARQLSQFKKMIQKRDKAFVRKRVPGEQTSFLVMIRHGEDCYSDDGLGKLGKIRANYVKRCMSQEAPSKIMPFGPPTALFATKVPGSVRPIETVTPLSRKLFQKIHADCSRKEKETSFVKYAECQKPKLLKSLQDKGTTVLSMTKHEVGELVKSFNVPGPRKLAWPKAHGANDCQAKSNPFKGEYCHEGDPETGGPFTPMTPKGISCIDAVWQIEFTRLDDDSEWKPIGFSQFFQNFQGKDHQECKGDFAPIQSEEDLELAAWKATRANATEFQTV